MPALAALLVALAAAALPPAPARWAEDHAGLMSEPVRAALDARLEAYQQATGHQVVVWVDRTLGGADLADWAVRTFAAWKVGRAHLDDGLVMFVLAADRTIDIEVGYGLEDKVPDAIASRVIREVMAPRLRANDGDGAITAGVDALLAAIEGHAWSPGATTVAAQPPSLATWILGGVGAVALLILLVTHPRLFLWLLLIAGRSIGLGGGGHGGGGFGGRGGRSGGGGARGGW